MRGHGRVESGVVDHPAVPGRGSRGSSTIHPSPAQPLGKIGLRATRRFVSRKQPIGRGLPSQQ